MSFRNVSRHLCSILAIFERRSCHWLATICCGAGMAYFDGPVQYLGYVIDSGLCALTAAHLKDAEKHGDLELDKMLENSHLSLGWLSRDVVE